MPLWSTGILTGTRGAQPTPNSKQAGTLYWVTDEEVLERWSGSAWTAYSAALAAAVWEDAGETWTYAGADDPTYTLTISGDLTGKYSAGMRVRLVQTTTGRHKTTLSTANNSESDVDFTVATYAENVVAIQCALHREKHLNLAAKTAYYLNFWVDADYINIYFRSDVSPTIIRAICAYL